MPVKMMQQARNWEKDCPSLLYEDMSTSPLLLLFSIFILLLFAFNFQLTLLLDLCGVFLLVFCCCLISALESGWTCCRFCFVAEAHVVRRE
jgi:hypothetical protein